MEQEKPGRGDDVDAEDGPSQAEWTPPRPDEPAAPEHVEAQPPEPDSPPTSQAEPFADETAESVGNAEIESWPSQDASVSSEEASSAPEGAAAGAAAAAWPTEPPAAGSGEADTWPTTPPEPGDEPIREPEWGDTATAGAAGAAAGAAAEPPPSEVEAYPAADDSRDEAAAAAAAATAAHTVPADEAATGESTLCPRCGTENRPGLAFCRNCGQRLVAAGVASTVERPGTPEGTTACPRCGTHNRDGVAFCQNCGANLRGTAAGYVPPAVAAEAAAAPAAVERRGAVLGPVVLLIGLIGLVTGYLLPFLYGSGSLFERASSSGGYGLSFWTAYPEVGAELTDQIYFGLTAPIPLLIVLLLALAIAGFIRAVPGPLQTIGLVIALVWSVALIVMFVVVELFGNWSGDIVGMLRVLSAAGIIFFLSSLIVLIGVLTRFSRS